MSQPASTIDPSAAKVIPVEPIAPVNPRGEQASEKSFAALLEEAKKVVDQVELSHAATPAFKAPWWCGAPAILPGAMAIMLRAVPARIPWRKGRTV